MGLSRLESVKAESSGELPPSVAAGESEESSCGAEVDSGRLLWHHTVEVTGACPGDALTAAGLKNNTCNVLLHS